MLDDNVVYVELCVFFAGSVEMKSNVIVLEGAAVSKATLFPS